MSPVNNLASQIEQSLPPDVLAVVKQASIMAEKAHLKIYLMGGLVRDLLLGHPNLDIDIVVDGDAIKLAEQLAVDIGGKITKHKLFNTAKIKLTDVSYDIAMLRQETYARPGALPAVQPGTLETDLFRRDFTINDMAISLNAGSCGELLDLHGGFEDLNNKLIRVLHDRSFIDDATRIWRAIRYEQRLGFEIEPGTLRLLERDISMLETVGGYRIRRELELVLSEKEPERMLARAYELGVLQKVHPALKADRWLVDEFEKLRSAGNPDSAQYFNVLTSRLNQEELQQLRRYLRV